MSNTAKPIAYFISRISLKIAFRWFVCIMYTHSTGTQINCACQSSKIFLQTVSFDHKIMKWNTKKRCTYFCTDISYLRAFPHRWSDSCFVYIYKQKMIHDWALTVCHFNFSSAKLKKKTATADAAPRCSGQTAFIIMTQWTSNIRSGRWRCNPPLAPHWHHFYYCRVSHVPQTSYNRYESINHTDV